MPYFKYDTAEFLMSNLPLETAQAMWNDPAWTKAVIWREPAERLLSAYLDKIVRQAFTQKYFHIGHLSDEQPYVLTFEEFVNLVANTTYEDHHDKRGIHYRVDPHWRPQLFTCGMDHVLPLFDFVGSFDHLPEHTKLLLERVGLWESYGKNFEVVSSASDTNTSASICLIPPPTTRSNSTIGFNQRTPSGNKHSLEHGTGSRQKMEQYYTPEMLDLVRKAYDMDYAIWDELHARASDNPLEVPTGRDFAYVKRSCALEQVASVVA
jgi:hypothetical protein